MASTVGTTYNITVPHTSPIIDYWKGRWYVDCPIANGIQICGDGETVTGTHFSNTTEAEFHIRFWGTALVFLLA